MPTQAWDMAPDSTADRRAIHILTNSANTLDMETSHRPAHNPLVSAQPPPLNSRAHSAHLARAASGWMQLVFVVALFVLWRVVHWDFWRAAEVCVVGGMLAYSAL